MFRRGRSKTIDWVKDTFDDGSGSTFNEYAWPNQPINIRGRILCADFHEALHQFIQWCREEAGSKVLLVAHNGRQHNTVAESIQCLCTVYLTMEVRGDAVASCDWKRKIDEIATHW